ncbi:MAG: vWA domain-containing protein [Kiritimatiellia bacterium]
MQVANPAWFWLLVPAALACWRILAPRKRRAIPFAQTQAFPENKMTWRILLYRAVPWCYPLILVMLITAMARPRINLSTFQREANAISIMVVVDVSGSMEALDLSRQTPAGIDYRTRLDVVKEVFKDFIAVRPDDLIGLISFGGYASVLSPLTMDHQAILQILASVETPPPFQDPTSGALVEDDERMTAIGDALALAGARLREAETQTRIVLLLSDGVNNAGILEPMQAANIARELGLRVYTIGVGTTGYAPVRVTDASGRQSMRNAYIEIDEQTLAQVATLTGGLYFNSRDEDGLTRALSAINELETTPVRRQILERYNEKYRGLLLTAAALLALCTLIQATTKQRIM